MLIKFPPSRAGKSVKCSGCAPGGGGVLKLRFDWYIIHESLSYLQNCPDREKQINRSQSHGVYLTEENLIECLNIEKENQRVEVCLLECNVNKETLARARSFQSYPSLVNRFLFKNPAMLRVSLLLSPFPIF